ncbi:hypothetical protein D3C71_1905840 [compost metagenome]
MWLVTEPVNPADAVYEAAFDEVHIIVARPLQAFFERPIGRVERVRVETYPHRQILPNSPPCR